MESFVSDILAGDGKTANLFLQCMYQVSYMQIGQRLKVAWHEIFDFRFFHEPVSPRPPSIPLGPFWIFSKIRGDIREWIFIAGVIDTGDKLFSGVNDTGEKFVDTGD